MLKITMQEPQIIAQADPSVKEWGYYQFPFFNYLPDGRIHIEFHINPDNMESYGLDNGHAVYDIENNQWERMYVKNKDIVYGHKMPNGNILMPVLPAAVDASNMKLPKPYLRKRGVYSVMPIDYYLPDDIDKEYDGFFYKIAKPGDKKMESKKIEASVPRRLRRITGGLLKYPNFEKVFVLPNDDVIISGYGPLRHDEFGVMFGAFLYISHDSGDSWEFLSTIQYNPEIDTEKDRYFFRRDGYHEPEYTVLPDGSIYALLRTEVDLKGPLYQTRSTDNGKTWGKQTVFDNLGVFPHLLTLKNGVTVATYGRPGLYMRATEHPDGSNFEDRITLINPNEDPEHLNTCSYTAMLPLSDSTFLLAYSDFEYPNEKGEKVKTLLSRIVKIEKQ